MATRKETVACLLEKLGSERFTVHPMFGEYALYADGKTVGFVCDDRLLVKIVPASAELAAQCGKGSPYPGAKPYHVVDEDQWSSIRTLPRILIAIAAALPEPKKRKKPGR